MRLLLGKKNISKFSLQCQILGRVGLVRQYYSIWYWLMFLTRMIGKLPICRVIPRRLMAHGFLVLFCGFKDHQEITGFFSGVLKSDFLTRTPFLHSVTPRTTNPRCMRVAMCSSSPPLRVFNTVIRCS